MTSKTIDIDERTYDKLLREKKDDETISEIIERLLGSEKKEPSNLRNFFGRWKDLPEDFFNIMKDPHQELRNGINEKFQ